MPDSDTIRSASESLCVVEEGFLSGRNGSRCLDVLDMAAQSSNLSNASAYRPAWSSAYSFQRDTWLNACQKPGHALTPATHKANGTSLGQTLTSAAIKWASDSRCHSASQITAFHLASAAKMLSAPMLHPNSKRAEANCSTASSWRPIKSKPGAMC